MTQTPGAASDELVRHLYDAEYPLHKPSAEMSLPEKFQQLLELQKVAYEILRARGVELRPWQKPWDVEP
jgi:hypothetical protein